MTFGYGRVPILRELSLCLHSAEFIAVTGANGSGKTTLLRLALGLLAPTHGTVRLMGVPLEEFGDWGSVGYVPQRAVAETSLPISVAEVVRTGLAGRLGLLRRPSAEHRAQMDHVLDLMGLADVRKASVRALSGGQQQRVLIARALVTEPRLLVLDEPTTGVDAEARHVLREALEHLVATDGIAVVYVSHDPEGFEALAHRILRMSAGRITEATPQPPRHDHATPARERTE